MSINTAINRLMLSSFQTAFYQELVSSARSFEALGNKLIGYAEQAHALRQLEKLREISEVLSNIPIGEYRYLGQYYLALSIHRNGKGNMEHARQILEHIVDYVPSSYRSRAILALAAISARKLDYDSELYYYTETIKAGRLDVASMEALRGIAILKAKEGYHNLSVKDLEKMYPLIKHAPSHIYFDYLNSLAVELGEVGRKYEARNIILYVLASPLAKVYPEWHSTAEDLRETNRSFIVIDPSRNLPRNVLTMPAVDRDSVRLPAWAGQPAQIVNYDEWKRHMAKKKKNGDKQKPIEDMSEADMFMEIMRLYTSDTTTDEQRLKMYKAIVKILSEPDEPEPPKADKPGA